MRRLSTTLLAAVFILFTSGLVRGQGAAIPTVSQSFALTDSSALAEQGVTAQPVEYRGRRAVRLTRDEPDSAGFAVIKGTSFRDGTIDVDLATNPTQTIGARRPGFVGIAFRIRSDLSHYEAFYLRPGNSGADDQAMRNHSVQYVAEPHFGWENLRRHWPSIYESWADLHPGEWTHVRIDVHGRNARLFINGSPEPSLIVDGLKGEDLQGSVALWTYSEEESYFSNLKVNNARPESLENGGEIAGTWNMRFLTDAGALQGTFKLIREDNTITGMFSGELGRGQPVNGIWRDGYVELTFPGTWPDESGTVITSLAGWVDGDSVKGRAKIDGRADGRWIADRQK
jgi:hypothetical protein